MRWQATGGSRKNGTVGPARSARSAPRRLPAGGEHGGCAYELAEDLVAIHRAGVAGTAAATGAGDAISVEPAGSRAAESAEDAHPGPVYRRVPGGGLAVPTGRVLVRFSEGVAADEQRDELARAGYAVEEILGYAPHAAWVRAGSGQIADALRDLPRLEGLAQVEHVEPQLLSQAARRR